MSIYGGGKREIVRQGFCHLSLLSVEVTAVSSLYCCFKPLLLLKVLQSKSCSEFRFGQFQSYSTDGKMYLLLNITLFFVFRH